MLHCWLRSKTTAKMSTYDKVISDLAKKIDGTPPQQTPSHVNNPTTSAPTLTNAEPEFGSLFTSGGTAENTRPKKVNKQKKNRHMSEPSAAPPSKIQLVSGQDHMQPKVIPSSQGHASHKHAGNVPSHLPVLNVSHASQQVVVAHTQAIPSAGSSGQHLSHQHPTSQAYVSHTVAQPPVMQPMQSHTITQPPVTQHVQHPVTQHTWGAASALDTPHSPSWQHESTTPSQHMHGLRSNPQLRATADSRMHAMEQAAMPVVRRKTSG